MIAQHTACTNWPECSASVKSPPDGPQPSIASSDFSYFLADVLVLVQPGTQHVVAEVERHQDGEQPVEVLQPGRIHVVRQPRRGAPDDADERRAKVEPERDDHGYHACGRVLERRGKLLVVQRHLPGEVQSLAEP